MVSDSATLELRKQQVARGLRLEYLTVAYVCIEAMVGLGAGASAGSIALVGFGLDSLIELTSGLALIWRLHSDGHARREHRDRLARRIVGICFLALAAYVSYEAAESLMRKEPPDASMIGIVLAAGSLLIMPLLARAKRRVADGIGSAALNADAKQTDLCAYLSAILLGGLLLNATLGWWWADPLAGAVMVPLIIKEGVDALRGKPPCGCA